MLNFENECVLKWCLWLEILQSLWIWKQMLIFSDQKHTKEELPRSCSPVIFACSHCWHPLTLNSTLAFLLKSVPPHPHTPRTGVNALFPAHPVAQACPDLAFPFSPFKCVFFQLWDLQTPRSHTEQYPFVQRVPKWKLLFCKDSFAPASHSLQLSLIASCENLKLHSTHSH